MRSDFSFYTAILSTGGVLLYLPHDLDLASEDSVGHSTCMSVLARRRAIMGSIVQPKRSCLGLSRCCHVLLYVMHSDPKKVVASGRKKKGKIQNTATLQSTQTA